MKKLKISAGFFAFAMVSISAYSFIFSGCATNTTNNAVLLQADFSEAEFDVASTWHLEGRGDARIDTGRLALQDTGVGIVLWAQQDFPSDVRLQFDLSFSNNRGIGVFFIGAQGLEGEDILTEQPQRDGSYDPYIKGNIHSYGFSLHRFFPDGRHNPGSNIRKNSGFGIVNHVEPDPIMQAGQIHRIQIEKTGGHLRLWVDDKLIHEWQDDGTLGPILQVGKIGFRIRGDRSCVMYLDNIVVSAL